MNNSTSATSFHCVCGIRVPEPNTRCAAPLAEHATRLEREVAELKGRLQSKHNALQIAISQRDEARREPLQQPEHGPRMTRGQVDQLERRARMTDPGGVVAVGAGELAELVDAYRRHRRRCASCGFERCEHLRSPACEGFSES